MLFGAAPLHAQEWSEITKDDLARIYAEARFALEFERITDRVKVVTPRPLERLKTASDTLGNWILQQSFEHRAPDNKPWEGMVSRWRLIQANERLAHRTQFETAQWAYLGNNYLTALDTVETSIIRARMQSRFGPPTVTLAEGEFARNPSQEENIQFEYWFILNDSVRVIVMDVNGPFDRGIIVAGDHRYRPVLYNLRQSFLSRMMREEPFGAYVDYYFNYDGGRWYQTGYDGRDFFSRPIREPDLAKGRPQLDAPGG